jgi:hypothetical protein
MLATLLCGCVSVARPESPAGLRSGELADLQIAVAFAERNSMTIKVTGVPGDYPFHGPLDLGLRR